MRPATISKVLIPRSVRFQFRRAASGLREAIDARRAQDRPVFEVRRGHRAQAAAHAVAREPEGCTLPGDAQQDDGAVYPVTFARAGIEIPISGQETLLEAGLAAGLDLAFSCTMGGCAACKVSLLSGRVYMAEPNCLSEDEAARGEILACVARPRAPLIIDA